MSLSWVSAVAGLLLVTGPVPGGSASAGGCAWPTEISPEALNVALPDTNARYWVMPFTVYPDREITVTGTYPDDRYISFTVYDGAQGTFTSNGVASYRSDFEIEPDRGSVNPWQEVAAAGGSYTLTLKMEVRPGEENVLPLAPEDARRGQTGFLVYRAYLPAAGSEAPVTRPDLTVTDGRLSRTLPQCPAAATELSPAALTAPRVPAALTAPEVPAASGRELPFARPRSDSELFPNPDTAYVGTWIVPPGPGRVAVIRGRAPVSPDLGEPRPWPRPEDQLRYWSFCTNLRYPYYPVVANELPGQRTDPGCRHDDVVRLDDDGWYTFAIGTEDQRRAVEALRGVTFVPWSQERPNEPSLVLLRNMMPVATFAHGAQNVPPTGNPAAARAVMGDYYPHGAVCELRTLAARGADGCGLP